MLAVDGGVATLEPVEAGGDARVATAATNALLTFEYRSRLVTLRGEARRDEVDRDLRFTVTDKVTVPQRRRHARVEVALPLRLIPLDAEGARAGERIVTRTRDVSAEGLLAEEHLPAAVERWWVELDVPDRGPTVVGEARIVRHVGGGTGMRYVAISSVDGQRLKQFVAAYKRSVLANLRKQGQ
ncbi:MAG TPA: PilZ domain-containing protein [Thermoleophilaceae bacterium]